MKKGYILIISIMLLAGGNAFSQDFWKTYPQFDKNDDLTDLTGAINNGFAFIGGMRFVLVDQHGEITRQWDYDSEGGTTYLRKMVRTTTGKYVVLASITGDRKYRLLFFSADGQLERTLDFPTPERIYSLKLLAGTGGDFYLTYLREMEDKPYRQTIYKLNATGQELWKRELGEGVLKEYALTDGLNGGLDIAYIHPEEMMLKVVQISEAGDMNQQDITGIWDFNAYAMPIVFRRTADGGYLFGGNEILDDPNINTELNLIKSGPDGRLQWHKLVDINMQDLIVDMHCDANGVYLLSNSGSSLNWLDDIAKSDMSVTRLGYDGIIIWKKAFGSVAGFEIPAKLFVNGNKLVVGGYGKLRPHIFEAPILVKMNLSGDLQVPVFPHTIQPSNTLQTLDMGMDTKTEELFNSIQKLDGGLISVIKVIGKSEDEYSTCLMHTNAQGQKQSVSFVSENAIPFSKIKKTNDGNYAMMVYEYQFGWRYAVLIKFDESGFVLWRRDLIEKTVGDFLPMPDGGFLVTGSENMGGDSFSTLLLKLDANGGEEWRKTYAFPDRWTAGTHIAIAPNNTIGILGHAERFYRDREEAYLLQTDLNGRLIAEQVITKRDSLISGNCILPTPDNHFLISGYTLAHASDNKDAFLMKVNSADQILLNKIYDFGFNDMVNILMPLGDTAYCMAGTSGEPAFGSRKMVGFLANIKPDGTNNGLVFIGDHNSALSIQHVYRLSANRLAFSGSWQKQYGISTPFIGTFDPGIILSAGNTDNAKTTRLYPNPANGTVYLQINNQFAGLVNISISTVNGIVVSRSAHRKGAGKAIIPIALNGLSAGLYQVVIVQGKNSVVKKLVVQP